MGARSYLSKKRENKRLHTYDFFGASLRNVEDLLSTRVKNSRLNKKEIHQKRHERKGSNATEQERPVD